MKTIGRQDGYSLMELIVSITVVSILTLTIGNFFVTATLNWTRNNTQTRLQAENQISVEIMRKDLREATAVKPLSTYGGSYATNSAELVLAVPAYTSGGATLFSDSTKTYACKNEVVYNLAFDPDYPSGSGALYRRTHVNTDSGCNAAAGNAGTAVVSKLAQHWSNFGFQDGDQSGADCIDVAPLDCEQVEFHLTSQLSQFGKTYSITSSTTGYLGSQKVEYLTYFFDGSDAVVQNGTWTNPSWFYDGGWSFASIASAGSTSVNYLHVSGTNAPSPSTRTIVSVEANMYCGSGTLCNGAIYTDGLGALLGTASVGGGGYPGAYITLSTPTGGWTWQKINDLEVKAYGTGSGAWQFGHMDLRVKVQ